MNISILPVKCKVSWIFYSFIIFLLGNQIGYGQDEATRYIELFESNFQLRTGLRYEDVEVRFFSNGEETFEFKNSSLGVTLGARIGKLGLSFTLPVADLSPSSTNGGRNIDINLQFYRPKYFLQFSGKRISGFQSFENSNEFRRDMRFWDLTLYGFRVYNSNLSIRAAFKNTERQIRSQGSWLSAITLNTQTFATDDGILFSEPETEDFIIDQYKQYEFGPGIGYAYTLVLSNNWFISPVLVVSPEFRYLRFRRLETQEDDERIRLSMRFRGRLAMGYNGDKFFCTVNGFFIPGFATRNRLNTRVQENQVRLNVGFRFQ